MATIEKKYPNKSGLDLLNMLRANCDAVVKEQYACPLSDEELENLKEMIVDNVLAIDRIEAEKKEIMTKFKEELDPLKKELSEATGEVKHKQRIMHGELFKFVEGDNVKFYNESGIFIYERRARPEEKQMTLPGATRAVNE